MADACHCVLALGNSASLSGRGTAEAALTLAAKAREPKEAPRVSSGVQQQIRREAATQPDA